MSRPAKLTLAASVLVSGLTVWGVHYMQERERQVMYRGVERDEARQEEKKRQRLLEHNINQQKEAAYQKMQPTAQAASAPSGNIPNHSSFCMLASRHEALLKSISPIIETLVFCPSTITSILLHKAFQSHCHQSHQPGLLHSTILRNHFR
ncbi:uncharacterized protein MEPE_01017 [Melanopsichium pennsylvanicum]|uniref:Cytochrome c oxidase assembly protein n=1 Tax=Melanopsichium pennsylvanicum TaxID=63383 RepID=A0AAJ4XHW4_9BASI|nr:uncharacterized protein MEPE_01017 [Melanopsichium pennsylvanicum]